MNIGPLSDEYRDMDLETAVEEELERSLKARIRREKEERRQRFIRSFYIFWDWLKVVLITAVTVAAVLLTISLINDFFVNRWDRNYDNAVLRGDLPPGVKEFHRYGMVCLTYGQQEIECWKDESE